MQTQLVAGDTLDFLTAVANYPATDGWTLKFRLTPRSSSGTAITFDASASGTGYRVQLAPTTTAAWAAGEYAWNSWVEKTGARYQVDSGQITIAADPASLVAGSDTRDHVRTVLDAIEAVIERRASKDQERYSVAGRELWRTPIPELLKLRQRYKSELAAQDAAARMAAGLGGAPRLQVRF